MDLGRTGSERRAVVESTSLAGRLLGLSALFRIMLASLQERVQLALALNMEPGLILSIARLGDMWDLCYCTTCVDTGQVPSSGQNDR